MRVCILGGTGHVGRLLVPLLADEGIDVIVVSRGKQEIPAGEVWKDVVLLNGDYRKRNEEWHRFIRAVKADTLIDLPGIDLAGTYHEIRNSIGHVIALGCYRMYGEPIVVPTPEELQRQCEFMDMAMRYQDILGIINQGMADGVKCTGLISSAFSGPGIVPISCKGTRDNGQHRANLRGETARLPMGGHTLIAPCDLEDVARAIKTVVLNPDLAAGEIFNVGPPYAITWEKYIQTLSTAYRSNVSIEFTGWDTYFSDFNTEPAENYYFRAHMALDISKIRQALDFEPMYTPEESTERGVKWMRDVGLL